MKRSIYLGLLFLAVSALSACNTYNYYTAGLNRTNMSGYHSFAWMPGAGDGKGVNPNGAADASIKQSATSALIAKGLSLKLQSPDLIVSYTATVGTGTKTNYYSGYEGYGGFYPGFGLGFGWGGRFGWGGGWGWGWGYRSPYYAFGAPFAYGGGLTYADESHYKEGTLIIDLIDRRTKKVVWRGYGVGEVHKDPKKNVDDIPKVVEGILKQLQTAPPANGVSMYRTMSS